MSEKDHIALLEVLRESRAKVILSGYENELYNKILEGWHKEETVSMTQKQKMAREVLWMNFQPERQIKLF